MVSTANADAFSAIAWHGLRATFLLDANLLFLAVELKSLMEAL